MQISFGQFIPVNIKCCSETKGKGNSIIREPYQDVSDMKKIEDITDSFALKLSRREGESIDELEEQQRRVFRANINDYALPPTQRYPLPEGKTSAVVGLTLGSNRYLVTGIKDVAYVQSNLYKHVNPYMFESDVVNYINKNSALSDRTVDIFVSENKEAIEDKDRYKVNMIDFRNFLTDRKITGECAR
ncbi:hypothetical protein IKQ26_09985 [bacterium]|nr:hypothetical protein [bacterium]